MVNFSALSSAALVRTLVALFFLALRLPAAGQAPAWQSAQAVAMATAAAAGNYSAVTGTAVDATGDVYLTGIFTNAVVLGATTLTSLGSYDVFVAKFNPISSQFVWARRAGGRGDDRAAELAVSGANVYVAGFFDSPTTDFGPITLANTTSVGYNDGFVAKLTDTGSFVWAQRAGGTSFDIIDALAVSGTNVYVAGAFASPSADFGSITLANVSSVGNSDAFLAKIMDAGLTSSFAWAQRAGGTGNDFTGTLAVSGTNVYSAGGFGSPTADFGSVTLSNL